MHYAAFLARILGALICYSRATTWGVCSGAGQPEHEQAENTPIEPDLDNSSEGIVMPDPDLSVASSYLPAREPLFGNAAHMLRRQDAPATRKC